MTLGEQARWWGVGLIALAIVLLLLADVLAPFVMGAAIAYFTDPLADRLQKRGVSRVLATVIITFSVLIAFILLVAIVTPLAANQIRLAVTAAPGIIDAIRAFVDQTLLPMLPIDTSGGNILSEALTRFENQVRDISVKILASAWSLGLAGVNFITLAVITPIVAFYLLLDWDNMVERIDDLLPRHHRDTLRELAKRVDRVLAGFVRGQLTVCLILGVFYAAGLIIVQLPFGLLVGMFAGLISFIPFVGSILGGALSIGIALFHFWDSPEWIVAVFVIFAIGQVVEGNFLSPKLVGGSVGLHPVWLMFSLSAFGGLFGFTGLLIAVPTAAVIGVFLRFSIEQYKTGRLYNGVDQPEDG